MSWVVFSYSIPAKSSSSPRVALWRRLRRVGAISPAGGVYVLPARDECIEAFQWLAQEIRQAKGEAVVMRVERFEGLTDQQLSALFNHARAEEYAEVEALLEALQQEGKSKDPIEVQQSLEKIRKRHAEVARVDYFNCPKGVRVAQRLAQLAERLLPRPEGLAVPAARRADYRERTWVTRPRPHVDRLACAWLIRRFIAPEAVIRYSLAPKADEVAFDMEKGGQFGHVGNLCTFETMRLAFGLDDPGLRAMAEIIHEIDLNDGRFSRPEAIGVDSILDGWHHAELADAELESRGVALFEGLYLHFAHSPTDQIKPRGRASRRKPKGVKS